METVEIFKPALDASGKFIGLDHETVFYDPDAFVQPLRRRRHRYTRVGRRSTIRPTAILTSSA